MPQPIRLKCQGVALTKTQQTETRYLRLVPLDEATQSWRLTMANSDYQESFTKVEGTGWDAAMLEVKKTLETAAKIAEDTFRTWQTEIDAAEFSIRPGFRQRGDPKRELKTRLNNARTKYRNAWNIDVETLTAKLAEAGWPRLPDLEAPWGKLSVSIHN